MEDLLTLHRKQIRDLQSVITQKKKSATKKTRRGVSEECESLERNLKEKQAAEIAALEGDSNPTNATEEDIPITHTENEPSDATKAILTKLEDTQLDDPAPTNHEKFTDAPKKQNRQKARLARRAAQIDEITEQAKQEAAAMPDLRAIEAARMKQLFDENNLIEIQIAPDGHCLYSAFALGLEDAQIPLSTDAEQGNDGKKRGYTFTRKAAGDYISAHADDFLPFLEEGETLDSHVNKIQNTAEWGGQMELLALAKKYAVTVKIVQATGVGVTSMNEDEGKEANVWLAYHRRGYGLGEHYNALRKKA
ncbi:hypothetical protein H072_8984 [Dactylellina haptotyla CBS 200.50]|uniref:OTU domain-containing protein n=1 Tax=Dactylellina haptotyla (strain CBS 200.50) TaxID=1284197 RepID=S8A3N6_DACHA|nr:hypothetical protein H072_8984 [Dactylellina haptotyla CBS 200.50]